MVRFNQMGLVAVSLLLFRASVSAEPWQTLNQAEAAALGWSRVKLAAARAFSTQLNTEAVLLIAGGRMLESWGAVDRKFNVHSIRKSFLSALVGIRSKEGLIDLTATLRDLGIDDNPPSLTHQEKEATVHDLLKARSGVYHPALYETAGMKARRPQRHSHAPGSFWYYNNWDFNTLGTIYEQRCDSGIYEDFHRFIAQPLGMEDFSVSDGNYVTGEDSIHRAYPFRMTARDMARFGLLFLRGGRWQNRQIVPEEWVASSTRSYSDAGTSGGYGYLWWTERAGIHLPGVTLPPGTYSARGAGGHYILIVPALDLIIVHRVNTDIEDRRVESAAFGELVRLILNAWEPPPDTPLETLLPLLMSRHRVPGAAALRLEKGGIASELYLGAQTAGEPHAVDANTLFEAASMTKPLAAFATLQLVEAGQLELDRPLRSYLGSPYVEGEPLHEKITARMVLNHTSGFPNWRPKGGKLQVLHQPGSAHLYSGEGFEFLQRVIEKITGTSFEDHLQNTLLQPLGMSRSSLVWQPARATQAAAGHDEAGRVRKDRRLYSRPNAAYTLYTTARDYAAFVREMMHPTLLSAETIAAMITPQGPPTPREPLPRRGQSGQGAVHFGLGWSIEPAPSGPRVRHSGSNGTGFRSYVEFDPVAGHGLVIFTNASGGDTLWTDLVKALGIP